jgi:hypothetical protein
MGLNLKNLLTRAPGLFSAKENVPESREFEIITEAMAERLAERAPKLLKGLHALQKNAKASQHHKIELQKWIDKENEELLDLKKTIRERKRSLIESLSENEKIHLAKRHPVWLNNFNIYLDQIEDLFAVRKNESTIVRCNVDSETTKSLKVFYYAADQTILCINSHRTLTYNSKEMPVHLHCETETLSDSMADHTPGEYSFRPVPGGQAQWTFTGNKWGIEDNIVWLDFGKNKTED